MQTETNKELNFDAIMQVAKSSKAAGEVFLDLSIRKKHFHRSINIGSYAEKLNISVEDAIQTFRLLEEQGLGSVIIGRDNTSPTMFVPQYSLKSIGVAGIDGKDAFERSVAHPEQNTSVSNEDAPAPLVIKRGRPKGSKNRTISRLAAVSANRAVGRPRKFNRSEYMKDMWKSRQASGQAAGKIMKKAWKTRKQRASLSSDDAKARELVRILSKFFKNVA